MRDGNCRATLAHAFSMGTEGGSRHLTLAALARLLETGMPADRALALVASEPATQSATALDAARRAGRGMTFPGALACAGLITVAERPFVDALGEAGRSDVALAHLARDLEREATLLRIIRGRLAVPGIVLVVAAITGPAPRLVAGALGPLDYGLAVAGPIVAGLIVVVIASRAAPFLGALVERVRTARGLAPSVTARRRVFTVLGRTLAAGVDADRAMAATVGAAASPVGGRVLAARQRVARGMSIADALNAHEVRIVSAPEFARLQAAEAAGALPDALVREADRLDAEHTRALARRAAWLPWIAYGAVVAFIVGELT